MKILVGYRGINVGNDLLKIAIKHAKAMSAEVAIVTSLPGGDRTSKEDAIEAETKLEQAREKLSAEGVACQTHLLVRGRTPGEDLISFATEHDVEEIIIGVKSRSKVGKILFGSTAQYVILQATCPVVSVK